MFKTGIQKCKEWLKRPATRRMGLLTVGLFVVFVIPGLAQAGVVEWFLSIIAKFFELLTRLVGFILFLEVKGLIEVAQYSNFVSPGPTAVRVGWVVARDLANMFFILILLVIAFATIIGYEEYNLRKLLPRLLIMAVVINFSKTITGIIIDMGQVIMLTFVNGFKDAAGGNFLSAFQVDKLLRLKDSGDTSTGGLVVGMMLAFVMVSVASMVVLIMLVTLIFRMVFLWVLIILSPIAFLASTIPPGRAIYSRWWDELKKYVVYGPIVAFFLWLALLTAQLSNGNIAAGEGVSKGKTGAAQQEITQAAGAGGSAIPTEAAESDVLLSMIIFTSLLFAGLKVATEAGGAVSQFTGGKVKGGAKKIARFGARQMARPVAATGRFAGRQAAKPALALRDRTMGGVGRGLASITGGRLGGGIATRAQRRVDKRVSARRELVGTPEELAKSSPSAFGQQAANAKGKDAQGFATAAAGDKKAMASLQKSGKIDKLRETLKAQVKNGDQGAFKSLQELNQAGWKSLEGDDQVAALATMDAQGVGRHVSAEDFEQAAPHLSEKGFDGLLKKKGVAEQMEGILEGDDGANKLNNLLESKGKTVGDIPVQARSQSEALQSFVLDEAKRNPAAMKQLAKTRDSRNSFDKDLVNQRTKDAPDGLESGRMALQSIMVGALKADDIDVETQKQIAQLPAKELATAARNAPDNDRDVQSAIDVALTGAVKYGGSEIGKSLTKLPGISERIDTGTAKRANATSASALEKVLKNAASTIKDIRDQGGNPAPLQASSNDLKTDIRNIQNIEVQLNEQKEAYNNAQKADAPKEDLDQIFEEISSITDNLNNQRDEVARRAAELSEMSA